MRGVCQHQDSAQKFSAFFSVEQNALRPIQSRVAQGMRYCKKNLAKITDDSCPIVPSGQLRLPRQI